MRHSSCHLFNVCVAVCRVYVASGQFLSLPKSVRGKRATCFTGWGNHSDSWVGLTLIYDVPPSCPPAQPVLFLGFHECSPKLKKIDCIFMVPSTGPHVEFEEVEEVRLPRCCPLRGRRSRLPRDRRSRRFLRRWRRLAHPRPQVSCSRSTLKSLGALR